MKKTLLMVFALGCSLAAAAQVSSEFKKQANDAVAALQTAFENPTEENYQRARESRSKAEVYVASKTEQGIFEMLQLMEISASVERSMESDGRIEPDAKMKKNFTNLYKIVQHALKSGKLEEPPCVGRLDQCPK